MTTMDACFDIGKLDRRTTIYFRLKGLRELAVRLRIAKVLFKAGAAVLGCGIEVSVDNGDE